MTREELKAHCEKQIEMCEIQAIRMNEKPSGKIYEEHKLILELLEQQPCEMTVEEYRQRMIQAFHNADTDELLAICVRPTEKEFEHLEWLLKNHYKQQPCDDAISRAETIKYLNTNMAWYDEDGEIADSDEKLKAITDLINGVPPVTPHPKTGRWKDIVAGNIPAQACDQCNTFYPLAYTGGGHKYCPNCGAKMVKPQESEE